MADKLRLGTEVRELKIGQSFTNNKAGAFHAVRYDFKPASVDINKIATVDIGNSNQVTVNVPHLDGAGVPATVFKGSHRPFTKECVLIIDRVTGEITLEKLSSNIQVKKTRSETTRPQLPQDRGDRGATSNSSAPATVLTSARPQTPPISQRQSNKTRVTSGSRRPDRPITQLPTTTKHSPLRASPNYASPAHKSPKRERPQNGDATTAASLPMIGIDDFAEEPPIHDAPAPPPLPATNPASKSSAGHKKLTAHQSDSDVHEMSDSSSSSSSSDSDSDHDVPKEKDAPRNGHGGNGTTAKLPSLPTMLLNDDLQLSESGSDYDDDD